MGGGWGVQVKGDRILWEMYLLLLETLSDNSWREQQWNDYVLLRWCNIINNLLFVLSLLINEKTFPQCIFHALMHSDMTGYFGVSLS